jgi:hypothetical protein
MNFSDLPGIADNPAFSLLKGNTSDKKDLNNFDIPEH